MFDKLVESSSTGVDLAPRRKIFAAASFSMAALLVGAVVTSIYAADFDLGTSNFDIAELLTPVTEVEPPREPEPEQARQNTQTTVSERPSRVMNIQRIDELPVTAPPVSTERSPYLSRPLGDFEVNPKGFDSSGIPSESDGRPVGSSSSKGYEPGGNAGDESLAKAPPLPPKVEKKPPPISGGAMAGKATLLPKPAYSAMAKSVGAHGAVSVQILVDESGKVVSAKAASGNPLLRPAAVEAAWKAKFKPATLSGVPVKVTGIITYNFVR